MTDDLTLIDCGDGRKVHITPPSVHRLVAETIARLEEERDVAVKVARNEIGWRKRAEARAERLEAAVLAAAKIGQIVGFLGEDEGRIEAFREACGPELWAKARAALKGADHE